MEARRGRRGTRLNAKHDSATTVRRYAGTPDRSGWSYIRFASFGWP